ncbi:MULTISPECIES: hypothetical protein [Clavibacter]|uniref:DUF600 family protein n=1 Tax=Clavibacter tessellarius TaxID=31965 RepID=A0A154V5U2_9MICO|nr:MULTISPECIES: hypothetical protein [Clavibacter]KZC96524.1 hypothetical protein AWH51_02160 [Clavibacter michiganensis subsp. tessellarius]MDA3804091.1 hypothetical protein [Clavibacter sp. CT19]
MDQEQVLAELIESWVSLALEYSDGAPDLTRIFVYAASERDRTYANVFFEQDGSVIYASELRGVDADPDRTVAVQRFLLKDLKAAETRLRELGAPVPTQYRVAYDTVIRQLDMQLSHEPMYANHPAKIMEEGAEDWLDGRLRKIFGDDDAPAPNGN